MIQLIIALLFTAIVMVVAFFIASLIQAKPANQEEGNAQELWVYGVTLTLVTLFSGILFLLFF